VTGAEIAENRVSGSGRDAEPRDRIHSGAGAEAYMVSARWSGITEVNVRAVERIFRLSHTAYML